MKNYKWEENPNWEDLQEINKGDIVHLKLNDRFTYLVKIIVESVSNSEIVGVSEAIFDFDSKMEISGGEKLDLVGKEFTFKKNFVQKIIK